MKKWYLIAVVALCCIFASCSNKNSPEGVARQFVEAVYDNDMAKAKTFMVPQEARRFPDQLSLSQQELDELKEKLKNSSYKVIPGLVDDVKTVRFYDPKQEYASKWNRWFCCSVELVKTSDGWQVTDYGY